MVDCILQEYIKKNNDTNCDDETKHNLIPHMLLIRIHTYQRLKNKLTQRSTKLHHFYTSLAYNR